MKLDNILVPTDFSDSSRHALHYAISFVKRFGSSLILLHVIEDLPMFSYASYEGLDVDIGTFQNHIRENAERELERLVRETPDLSDLQITSKIRMGIPYKEVIEEVAESAVDLIILATHGRSGFSHFLMGSVAEKIVRNAPCPVLTVKVPEPKIE